MIEGNERDMSVEVEKFVVEFENLEGEKKLELIKVLLEKMENGEIEVKEKTIYPADIGIEDGFACVRAILKLLK